MRGTVHVMISLCRHLSVVIVDSRDNLCLDRIPCFAQPWSPWTSPLWWNAFHEPGEMPHSLGDPEGEGFTDNFRQWCKYGEGSEYADKESYSTGRRSRGRWGGSGRMWWCWDENPLLVTELPYRRLGCFARSLQLVIKEVYKGPYSVIIAKTQGLLGWIRKFSVAMEKVISKCGKGVISDNSTRWNSTYMIVQRLLEVKVPLSKVLIELNIDSLLTSCCLQFWRNICRPT